MDENDIYYEKVLNRIIQGRLRLRVGDLVLYIREPDPDLLEESFDIYEEYYQKAFFKGCFVESEILELLLEAELWSPDDDRKAEKIIKDLDEIRVEAYNNFYNKKKLRGIKQNLRNMEANIGKLRYKKKQLHHVTCDGMARFAQRTFLIRQTTTTQNGDLYDFRDISISSLIDLKGKYDIDSHTYRKIARSQPWRSMWVSSKDRASVFGRPAVLLDQHQLQLSSFSTMYDNVYESPDAPKDEVIADDDCLDGWFIVQKRDYEQKKAEYAGEGKVGKNSKIANSQEVFLMAQTPEEIEEIYSMNNVHARNTIRARQQQIRDAQGQNIHIRDLHDVKMDNQMARVQATNQRLGQMNKGRSY